MQDVTPPVPVPAMPTAFPQLTREQLLALAGQWRDLIDARGRIPAFVAERHMQVCRVLDLAGYVLTDATVTLALGRLRAEGRSHRTCNKYLQAIKSFTCWLARPSARLLPFDPLTELRPFNTRRDRRHERTSFWPVFEKLLAAAASSPRVMFGMSGPERAELYHAAACTGVRFGTLAKLTVGQFDLSGAVGIVRVRADQAKGGRDVVVPIQPDSTARLRRVLAGKSPNSIAFKTPKYATGMARLMRVDLAAAGVPYCREVKLPNGKIRREQVLDFHALRHTFATWHASAGTPLATLQKLMGHSTPELTANVYSHLLPPDAIAAAAKLPPLPGIAATVVAPTAPTVAAPASGEPEALIAASAA